jgi:hypothetical protein
MRTYPKVLLTLTTALLGGGIVFTAPASADPPPPSTCSPVQYWGASGGTSWYVCDTDGHFVHAGDCPPGTVIVNYPGAFSPYCVPPDFRP